MTETPLFSRNPQRHQASVLHSVKRLRSRRAQQVTQLVSDDSSPSLSTWGELRAVLGFSITSPWRWHPHHHHSENVTPRLDETEENLSHVGRLDFHRGAVTTPPRKPQTLSPKTKFLPSGEAQIGTVLIHTGPKIHG